MNRFDTLFDTDQPLIAMAHVPPLPGTPLYDADRGMSGLVESLLYDVEILCTAGFDAVLFCNEGDRPYSLNAGLEAAAAMSAVVTTCRPSDRPFGVDYLWDARCALAVAVATDAAFMRAVATGAWESDMGPWQTDAAALWRERRRLGADKLAILLNVTPEFASPIGQRSPAEFARSCVVSTMPDAILVSGPMAGAAVGHQLLADVREAVPSEVPVLVNTGARHDTIVSALEVANGCIVGSDLKVDGDTWAPVSAERAERFVRAVRG